MDLHVIIKGNRIAQRVLGFIRGSWEDAERLCQALDAEAASVGETGDWHWWDEVSEIAAKSVSGPIGAIGPTASEHPRLYAPGR